MRKKVLIVIAALVVVALPASIAVGERYKTKITAQANDDQDEIFGVVRSAIFACEKRREVRLYGPEFSPKRRGDNFVRFDETKTNRFGEYSFEGFSSKQRGGFLPPGDYFTRALRKDFPGDVCRRADSDTVTIFPD
jgi:hypothetical protein